MPSTVRIRGALYFIFFSHGKALVLAHLGLRCFYKLKHNRNAQYLLIYGGIRFPSLPPMWKCWCLTTLASSGVTGCRETEMPGTSSYRGASDFQFFLQSEGAGVWWLAAWKCSAVGGWRVTERSNTSRYRGAADFLPSLLWEGDGAWPLGNVLLLQGCVKEYSILSKQQSPACS